MLEVENNTYCQEVLKARRIELLTSFMMQQLTMNDHPLTLLRSARMQDGCLHKGAIISDVQDYEPAGSHLSAEGLIGGFPCQVGNPAVL